MKKTITITVDYEDYTEVYVDNIPKYIEIQVEGMYVVDGKLMKLKKKEDTEE